SGLNEGDNVALINAAMLQQARTKMQQRIQSRMGLPGVNQSSGSQRSTSGPTTTKAPGGGGGGRARPGTP
ncbi:MAG: hypothetical protein ACREMU_05670, partial [Gemmatimonadaceae bacterium]